MSVSAVVLTKDSEKHIAACLDSLKWVDELLVIDSGSTDRTREIAESVGAKFIYNVWPGFAAQRNFALDLCTNDWVLMIDADEYVPVNLVQEIKEELNKNRQCDFVGYSIPTKNHFWGKWMRGWYPDRHIRLFSKSKGRYQKRGVHESVVLNGSIKPLKSPLIHYSYDDATYFVNKMNIYSTLGAQEMIQSGKGFSLVRLFIHPFSAFFKMYILKCGFRDGIAGFVFCTIYSFYVFLKYAKLFPADGNK